VRVDRTGQHVVYTLTELDVARIEASREGARHGTHNSVEVAQSFPAFIVRDWATCANLRVLLDGRDDYWVTSVPPGQGPGTWREPNPRPIVED
jgi:hypothetical protein